MEGLRGIGCSLRVVATLCCAVTLALGLGADSARADSSILYTMPGATVVVGGDSDNELVLSSATVDGRGDLISGSEYLTKTVPIAGLISAGGHAIAGGLTSATHNAHFHWLKVVAKGQGGPLRGLGALAAYNSLSILRGVSQTLARSVLLYPVIDAAWRFWGRKKSLVIGEYGSGGVETNLPCADPRLYGPTRPRITRACPVRNDPTTGAPPVLVLVGGGGNDRLSVDQVECNQFARIVVLGGPGHDLITGSRCGDDILAGTGKDWVSGGDGDDNIYGLDYETDPLVERDDDHLFGDAGADFINGGPHNDLVAGGVGNDTRTSSLDPVNDGLPDDLVRGLHGGEGNDTVVGGRGVDAMFGDGGRDTIWASEAYFGAADERDEVADCGAGDSGQFYLNSQGDPLLNCTNRVSTQVTHETLAGWDPEHRWPWFP